MKILRISAVLLLGVVMFALLGWQSGAAQMDPCAAHPRVTGSLYIAHISCQSDDEVVVVINGSGQSVDLTGFHLIDMGEGRVFTFDKTPVNSGCCVLKPYDVFRIHTGLQNFWGYSDSRDLHWMRSPGVPEVERIWGDRGGEALLANPDGWIVDDYVYGNF